MKSLAVVVTTPPYSPLTITAINYIHAAIAAEVKMVGVFFYQEGVLNANDEIQIASDEYQAVQQWQQLHQKYNVPLHLCVTAAEKRGMKCDNNEQSNINAAFTVSGLGELVDLSSTASRLVQF